MYTVWTESAGVSRAQFEAVVLAVYAELPRTTPPVAIDVNFDQFDGWSAQLVDGDTAAVSAALGLPTGARERDIDAALGARATATWEAMP